MDKSINLEFSILRVSIFQQKEQNCTYILCPPVQESIKLGNRPETVYSSRYVGFAFRNYTSS